MKKHWQIKPWVLITMVAFVVVVLAGSVIGYLNSHGGKYGYSEIAATGYGGWDYDDDYSMDVMEESVPNAAPQALKSVGSSRMIAATDSVGEMDEGSDSERMIIKTGHLSIVVDDVRESVQAVIDYAEENGGFLVNSNIDKEDIALFGSVTVRIPTEKFDEGVTILKELGDTESENINGRDVTEEYTDLDSQLRNLEATEEQFLEIMKKAYEIEDILAVQRELTWVRNDIESIEGRMKYLRESSDMSTLTVYLSTDPSALPVVDDQDKWKPFAVIKDALRSLLGFGQTLVNGVIWLVIYIPVWAVIGLIVWGIVRVVKKWMKKK